MKGILLLNGTPYSGEIDNKDALVFCCDGAYKWASGKVKIDENVGDFDSLDVIPTPPPKQIFPAEKDFTDGEIALSRLLEKGVDDVEIYGGFGGRTDHFLGNLQLLYKGFTQGVKCRMYDDNTICFIADGKIELGEFENKTFSLLPFNSPVHIMASEGCKYTYPEKIGFGECRGISNVVQKKDAYVSIKKGDCALIIINRGKV